MKHIVTDFNITDLLSHERYCDGTSQPSAKRWDKGFLDF